MKAMLISLLIFSTSMNSYANGFGQKLELQMSGPNLEKTTGWLTNKIKAPGTIQFEGCNYQNYYTYDFDTCQTEPTIDNTYFDLRNISSVDIVTSEYNPGTYYVILKSSANKI